MARNKKQLKQKLVIDDAIIPRLLEENKYFDESLDDARDRIEAKGRVEWHTIHFMRDNEGRDVEIPLALKFAGGGVMEPDQLANRLDRWSAYRRL